MIEKIRHGMKVKRGKAMVAKMMRHVIFPIRRIGRGLV